MHRRIGVVHVGEDVVSRRPPRHLGRVRRNGLDEFGVSWQPFDEREQPPRCDLAAPEVEDVDTTTQKVDLERLVMPREQSREAQEFPAPVTSL